jgi:hypothetical protein
MFSGSRAELQGDRSAGEHHERECRERLVVCRNPAVAAERVRKRSELLVATETELEKTRPASRVPAAGHAQLTPVKSASAVSRSQTSTKVAKHFTRQITGGAFAYERKTEQINSEAALDGLCAIRTTLHADQLGAPAAVRAYKQLKTADHAFRTLKDTIEIRPIHHRCGNTVCIGHAEQTSSRLTTLPDRHLPRRHRRQAQAIAVLLLRVRAANDCERRRPFPPREECLIVE